MGLVDEAAPLRVGPARTALNRDESTIHNPETARKLGFRGAAVGANLHLDIFAPLLIDTYGPAWFERGALSLYFLNVVISGEAVQAVVETPGAMGAQARIHAQRADEPDFRVCEGTASFGDTSRSELRMRDLRLTDESNLRLLRGLTPGQSLGSAVRLPSGEEQSRMIAQGLLNEPLDWYQGSSPWGGPIASVGLTAMLMMRLLYVEGGPRFDPQVFPALGDAAGMFGAFEIAYENGPVFLDRPYTVEGAVVGVGESPKTEYLWWDAVARDEKGVVVARMRELLRFLKASSPHYPQLAGA